ncbi:hypothetical protein E8E13_002478 [Curvularia kusanoi]|uniref:Spherulin-4 n=1 Tax=Curvularia kusanoi TaxID=90978 RepID=A0A9P4T3Z9_CURKU|nr:hypothetical protein E8E13_002478 [Curvularia kusanoi]
MSENPGLNFYIILNPGNGPGNSIPDANYVAEVARLRMMPNATLFGYVHVSWGERERSRVNADISAWAAWKRCSYPDIHMDGIFLDEAPSSIRFLEYVRSIKQYAAIAFSKSIMLWSNPGVPVDSAFYAEADIINACEEKHDRHMLQKILSSTPALQQSKTSILIHDYNGSTQQLCLDVQALRYAGYGSALITTDSNYTKFSDMWSEFVTALAMERD